MKIYNVYEVHRRSPDTSHLQALIFFFWGINSLRDALFLRLWRYSLIQVADRLPQTFRYLTIWISGVQSSWVVSHTKIHSPLCTARIWRPFLKATWRQLHQVAVPEER